MLQGTVNGGGVGEGAQEPLTFLDIAKNNTCQKIQSDQIIRRKVKSDNSRYHHVLRVIYIVLADIGGLNEVDIYGFGSVIGDNVLVF